MANWNTAPKFFVTVSLIGLSVFSRSQARGGYSDYSQATIGEFQSQTEATVPSNRERAQLGIGEKVACSLDIGTWVDCDFNNEMEEPEGDSIGSITWELEGQEAAHTNLSTKTGATTTMTASGSPGSVTVKATVLDSRQKFPDTPVVKTKTFTTVAPSALSYIKTRDDPPWIDWRSGDKYLGCMTYYRVTVSPTTVSFKDVQIREYCDTPHIEQWPDGSTWSSGTVDNGPKIRISGIDPAVLMTPRRSPKPLFLWVFGEAVIPATFAVSVSCA